MLEPNVLPYLQGLATAIFQQDNARLHVARIVQRFFVNHQIELLPRLARFSDLSPIENMWSMVAQRLTQITPPGATLDQLWQRVEAAWSAVPQEHIQYVDIFFTLKNEIKSQTSKPDQFPKSLAISIVLNHLGTLTTYPKPSRPDVSATCHSFTLSNGISIVGPCTYQNSDVCNAQCVNNGQVLWKEETKCLSGGQWSPLPPCHTANSLELIRCDKLADITQENIAACVKIKITVRGSISTPKAICPEILQLFVKFGNCSAELGTNCTVSCPYGGFVLQCVTNRHENCIFPVTSLCPELKSVKLINCSRVAGAFCKVRINAFFDNNSFFVCDKSGSND
ncbi:uncharacterized protein TNCV_266271 [Trichonephila clavipes]|nr:uncharacterized protein TNCV_266271 [Trichonephila clavipes]